MPLQYALVGTEDGSSNVTVFVSGRAPLVAHSSHPNFSKIIEGVVAGDESVVDLFDTAQTAVQKFERLTERVTVNHGRLYLDHEEVNDALATQVLRFLEEGVEDWKPLIKFFENVQANPNEHSREMLYTWLQGVDNDENRQFTITPEGLLVGYKGVESQDGENFRSIHSGRAIVNGEIQNGRISQKVGDIVEMPRGEVQFDPEVGCHTGLHVGTYKYASGYNHGALLEVHVNPRDVVSVPTECYAQKVRVCRYTVIGTLDAPYDTALSSYDGLDDEYDGWGDGEDYDDEFPLDDVDFGDSATLNESSAPGPVNEPDVRVGDRFQDLDKRRNRVINVTQVEGDTVQYVTKDGKGGSISAKRLLTPYRFARL